MDVFDAGGRRVRGIPVGFRSAGEHVLRWDGRDGAGQPVATGVYFLRVGVDGKQLTRRLAVVRLM
jgi:flagellar hook assembly protein FlgD